MDTSKIIRGVVSSGRYTVTAPIVKEDYGLYLKIEGVELPSTYEVDFSNSESSGTSVTMIGNADGVLIPRQFIDSGKDVFAFLYHVGANYGRTVYKFRIPNKVRPDRTSEQPTPEEQSVIDQTISALNEAVEQTAQDKADADASAQSAKEDADRAEQAKDDASTFAQRSANSAQASADYSESAQASATASANSASQSAQIKTNVESMVDDAQGYADVSHENALASANNANMAQGYAQSASASAQSASGYASSAQTSAQTASAKAQDASQSATTASQKATESAQSATQALSYKTDAESAKTASQTAQGLAESARDSAIFAKNDAEQAKADAESARDEAQQAVASISGALDDKADIITDTASGSIASFPDGADNLPLKSLVVDINPIQDLHGQDSPYPAGGGKNLFDANTAVQGYYISDGIGELIAGDASYASDYIEVDAGQTYRISPTLSSGNWGAWYDENKAFISGFTGYTTAKTAPSNAKYLRFTVSRNGSNPNYATTTQVEKGSEATAWTPYENICPISGWTSVDVEQSGVNVWDEEWEVGGIGSSSGNPYTTDNVIRSKNYIPVIPNTDYYFNIPAGTGISVIAYYDANYNTISTITSQNRGIKTTPTGCAYMKFQITSTYGSAYNHDISINYPSTDHDYHPYTGRSLTINLGQTVYGGKLDVLSGELVIDRAMVDMGTKDWVYTTDDAIVNVPYFNGKLLDRKPGSINFICSCYANTGGTRPSLVDKSCATYNSSNSTSICIADSAYTDATAFKAAVTGQTLVYELAEPIEIQLTPNQVNSLLGVNNIWADSGDTEVEYRADTKLYIAKKIAEAISALS